MISVPTVADCFRQIRWEGERSSAVMRAGKNGITSIRTKRTGRIPAENVSVRTAARDLLRPESTAGLENIAALPAPTGAGLWKGKRNVRRDSLRRDPDRTSGVFYSHRSVSL